MEVPGKPGAYRAVAFLRPHFQLDELTVSLRLVAELPPPAVLNGSLDDEFRYGRKARAFLVRRTPSPVVIAHH